MRKGLITLISLGFFVIQSKSFAQAVVIDAKPVKARQQYTNQDSRTSIDQWESEQHIKNNFDHLSTVPFFANANVELEFGPAQFQITVPFN